MEIMSRKVDWLLLVLLRGPLAVFATGMTAKLPLSLRRGIPPARNDEQ